MWQRQPPALLPRIHQVSSLAAYPLVMMLESSRALKSVQDSFERLQLALREGGPPNPIGTPPWDDGGPQGGVRPPPRDDGGGY